MIAFLEKLGAATVFSVLGLCVFFFGLILWGVWHDEWSGYNASVSMSDGICNIAIVPINGDITSFYAMNTDSEGSELQPAVVLADNITSMLRRAAEDPAVEGVLVRIDSAGGSPVASEIIAKELKRSTLPSAALIREVGASGAYLVATGADTIIASPLSSVGGIGVTMSYLTNAERNKLEGTEYVALASAPFKDAGSPDKAITPEERARFESDLKTYHNVFVQEVAANRGLSEEEVAARADGWAVPGAEALSQKLIDALGDQETAREWFATHLNKSKEEIRFCEW